MGTVTHLMKIPLVILILNLTFLFKVGGKYLLVETKDGANATQLENKNAMDEHLEGHGADYGQPLSYWRDRARYFREQERFWRQRERPNSSWSWRERERFWREQAQF